MVRRIERDRRRFEQIVRGRIKQDLKRHITRGELIGKRGDELVSIPLPHIELPHFRFGQRDRGGVGQGPGEPGTPIGSDGEIGEGNGAGDSPGHHIREVELTVQELAEIIGEELELPRIEPKGSDSLTVSRNRYTGIKRSGPDSLRSMRRTYKEALKRQLAGGVYNSRRPLIVPVKEDMRYRSSRSETHPIANAVIIYMMDVSGSMGNEQKEIVRIESFWIDTWIRAHYAGLETRYIIHDAAAREVDRETFYSTRESGGTRISSAYQLAADVIGRDFPPDEWNIYLFHFSDGDNWGGGDDDKCFSLLHEHLLPAANLFGYGQVESRYGSGQFMHALESHVKAENLILSRIDDRDTILRSIKDFLGAGK
jgi:sporulation protein YhbH